MITYGLNSSPDKDGFHHVSKNIVKKYTIDDRKAQILMDLLSTCTPEEFADLLHFVCGRAISSGEYHVILRTYINNTREYDSAYGVIKNEIR